MRSNMTGNQNMPKRNLYEVLDCTPESSLEELKQAYHRKVLESHPDKNKVTSSQLFREVKLAWEILRDPNRRKDYDIKCKQDELEIDAAVIYARLSLHELETTEDEDILSYPCRCGNRYLVQKIDLEETNCILQIPCQDCTFVISIET